MALRTTALVAALAPALALGAPRDDDFDVQSELGTLDQSAIDGPLGAASGAVQGCYRSAVAKQWYLGGRLEVKVRVRGDGAVKQVATTTPLGNRDVEQCVAGVVGGLKFATPRGGREAEFDYGWDFRGGKAPLTAWGNGDVGRQFAKHRGELAACGRPGGLPRGLKVTFFVLPGGKVASVGVGADVPVADGVARCIAGRVAAWRFDDPLGAIARATWDAAAE